MFQINPLIKDYNGPACAYVTGPLGGFAANGKGERFIECDYWSGQMMWEFYQELQIVADITVPLPRPRDEESTVAAEFIDIKRCCMSLLRQSAA